MTTKKPPKQTARLDGKKKLIAMSTDLENELRRFCRDRRIENESEVIRQAVIAYIRPEDYADATLKLRGLKDLGDAIAELRDMLDIIFRYQRLSHINLMAYHPEIDPSLADAALSSAMNRHNRFFTSFQDSLKADPPFFERLLHTYFSGDHHGQS